MIVESYKLSLTCDGCEKVAIFESESPERTRANAQDQGWKVKLAKERCFCPLCGTGGVARLGPES